MESTVDISSTHDSPSIINSSQQHQVKNGNCVPCPHCGKLYLRINTHISRAHPEHHRQNILNRQFSKSSQILHSDTDANTCDGHHNLGKPIRLYKEKLMALIQFLGMLLMMNNLKKKLTILLIFLKMPYIFYRVLNIPLKNILRQEKLRETPKHRVRIVKLAIRKDDLNVKKKK